MPAPSDALGALKTQFPRVTDRPSADHPAIDVPPEECLAVLRRLRDVDGYDFLVDVTAVDQGEDASPRFTLVYHLLSTTALGYIRVATVCADNDEPLAASATGLWPAADWHEREVFDMFGIRFSGHSDLRRILMWDGYPYHPLRKEFPLAGIETALPDLEVVAATGTKVIAAPMAGGPFVSSAGEINLTEAEPRAKDESWNEASAKPE
jgi:NADH-quinone oxidoreductase subunit C